MAVIIFVWAAQAHIINAVRNVEWAHVQSAFKNLSGEWDARDFVQRSAARLELKWLSMGDGLRSEYLGVSAIAHSLRHQEA